MSDPFQVLDDALAAATRTLNRLDVSRMARIPAAPVDWSFKPLAVRGAVTMLAGQAGTGKSALALAAAAALGRGQGLAGLEAGEPGTVLYVDAENGGNEIHRRVHGLNFDADRLVYAEADGFDLLANFAELEAMVVDTEPVMVVLDSLRSLAPSWEENESSAAESVLAPLRRLARRYGCAVVVLHHSGKGDSAQDYRGSSGIAAAIEIGFTLARDKDDPERRTRRRLHCWKMRPAAEPEPLWLKLASDGDTLDIAAAKPFNKQDDQQSEHDDLASRVLLALAEAEGPVPLAQLCHQVVADPESGTTKRTLNSLATAGLISRPKRGIYEIVRPPGPSDGRSDGQLDL